MHSAHGQLSRSQIAGKRSCRPPAASSSHPSLQFTIDPSGVPRYLPGGAAAGLTPQKVGYTS